MMAAWGLGYCTGLLVGQEGTLAQVLFIPAVVTGVSAVGVRLSERLRGGQ
jgi:hypothetical protein